jgi:hypothetical protein
MRLVLFIFSLVFSIPTFALPQVECSGFLLNLATDEFINQNLKQSLEDPNYYRTDILNYSIGADHFYLSQGHVGLVIYNNKTDRAGTAQVGFSRIGETKAFRADLKFYDSLPSGEKIVVGVQCGYTEP